MPPNHWSLKIGSLVETRQNLPCEEFSPMRFMLISSATPQLLSPMVDDLPTHLILTFLGAFRFTDSLVRDCNIKWHRPSCITHFQYTFIMMGYHRIAEFMSAHGEVAILRRFGKLNMLNLLYLQADLTRLEHDLSQIASVNSNTVTARDWIALRDSTQIDDERQSRIALELRDKLGQFS